MLRTSGEGGALGPGDGAPWGHGQPGLGDGASRGHGQLWLPAHGTCNEAAGTVSWETAQSQQAEEEDAKSP